MIYPKFLEKNSKVGITALSCGCSDALDEIENAINAYKKDYEVIVTDDVYGDHIVSADKETRVEEFNTLLNHNLSLINIARGGNFLYETLDGLKFNEIKEKPLWFMGYSDVTSLLYILTTKYDIATIYGFNAKTFGDLPLLPYQLNCLEILKGNLIKQTNFRNLNYSINGDFESSGIIIGGCIEVLRNIIGTKYDNTKNFIEKYKDYRIIWYFDIFNTPAEDLYITLLQFRDSDYFKYTDTFIVSKVLFPNEEIMTYKEAFNKAFPDKNIIMECDIGHIKPVLTIINGSYVNIKFHDKNLEMTTDLLI